MDAVVHVREGSSKIQGRMERENITATRQRGKTREGIDLSEERLPRSAPDLPLMNGHLLLTANEEKMLTMRYRETKDPKIRERLILSNLRLVASFAKKYARPGVELADIEQLGVIGLIKAIDHFDPSLGYRFSTYAFHWIRQCILRGYGPYVRTIRLPVHVEESVGRIHHYIQSCLEKNFEKPNLAEIEDATGIPEKKIGELLKISGRVASLDAKLFQADSKVSRYDLFRSQTHDPADLVLKQLDRENLNKLLGKLSDKQELVLALRFGLDGQKEHTLHEVGQKLKVSRERVRQIEADALRTLHKLANDFSALGEDDAA